MAGTADEGEATRSLSKQTELSIVAFAGEGRSIREAEAALHVGQRYALPSRRPVTGLYVRRVANATLYTEGFDDLVTAIVASIATGWCGGALRRLVCWATCDDPFDCSLVAAPVYLRDHIRDFPKRHAKIGTEGQTIIDNVSAGFHVIDGHASFWMR